MVMLELLALSKQHIISILNISIEIFNPYTLC